MRIMKVESEGKMLFFFFLAVSVFSWDHRKLKKKKREREKTERRKQVLLCQCVFCPEYEGSVMVKYCFCFSFLSWHFQSDLAHFFNDHVVMVHYSQQLLSLVFFWAMVIFFVFLIKPILNLWTLTLSCCDLLIDKNHPKRVNEHFTKDFYSIWNIISCALPGCCKQRFLPPIFL